MMMKPLVVIAVGGNSLISDAKHMSVMDQYLAAGQTSCHIASLVAQGYRVLITHGNGPQVGFILMRSELARSVLHEVPLESCVADTQGAIGYQMEQTLRNELRQRGLQHELATLVTQVVVSPDDPAFSNPDKPIGPFYSQEDAHRHSQHDGWTMREDAGRGWRRVVPSPHPLEVVEEKVIRILLDHDVVVLAAGGGGIPVVRTKNGQLEGCPAVIDKDAASCLLAKRLQAHTLIISTSVDKVMLHYGTPRQQALDKLTVDEAERYLQEGHFAAGSMRPKIEAAIDFLKAGGARVIITQPHLLEQAIEGRDGTHITRHA
jgi:carbamate kinase